MKVAALLIIVSWATLHQTPAPTPQFDRTIHTTLAGVSEQRIILAGTPAPMNAQTSPQARLTQVEWQHRLDLANSRAKSGKRLMILGGIVVAIAVPLYFYGESACANATLESGPLDCRTNDLHPEVVQENHQTNLIYLATNLGLGAATLIGGGLKYSHATADIRALESQRPGLTVISLNTRRQQNIAVSVGPAPRVTYRIVW